MNKTKIILFAAAILMMMFVGVGYSDGPGDIYYPMKFHNITRWDVENVTTTPYTADKKGFILCDCTSNPITVNLPAAANYSGMSYSISKTDATANAVTVTANGAELIDGSATYSLSILNYYVTVFSTGTGWKVVSKSVSDSITSTATPTATPSNTPTMTSTQVSTMTPTPTPTILVQNYFYGQKYFAGPLPETTPLAWVDGISGSVYANGMYGSGSTYTPTTTPTQTPTATATPTATGTISLTSLRNGTTWTSAMMLPYVTTATIYTHEYSSFTTTSTGSGRTTGCIPINMDDLDGCKKVMTAIAVSVYIDAAGDSLNGIYVYGCPDNSYISQLLWSNTTPYTTTGWSVKTYTVSDLSTLSSGNFVYVVFNITQGTAGDVRFTQIKTSGTWATR